MKSVRTIGLNTIYQILGRAITASAGLLVTRLITSTYGVDGYGQYQTVITYVTLFWVLTDFGFNAIAVREMASSDEKRTLDFYSSLVTLRLVMGLSVMLAAVLLSLFLPYSPLVHTAIFVASLTIMFQSLGGIGNALFQLKLKYGYQLLSSFIGTVVSVFMFYWAAYHEWNVVGLAVAFATGSAVMGFANLVLARRLLRFNLKSSWETTKYLIRETLPFGLVLLFSLLILKADSVMLSIIKLNGGLTNERAVGIYNLSFKIFELVLIVPAFFMNTMYPVLLRKLNLSVSAFKNAAVKTMIVLVASSIVVMLALYVSAPYLVNLLAKGAEFADSIKVLRLLALSTPLFFTTGLLMWTLVIFRKQRALIAIYGFALFVNVTLNYLFIPDYHYFAAAITTGITELVILICLSVYIVVERKSFTKDAISDVASKG